MDGRAGKTPTVDCGQPTTRLRCQRIAVLDHVRLVEDDALPDDLCQRGLGLSRQLKGVMNAETTSLDCETHHKLGLRFVLFVLGVGVLSAEPIRVANCFGPLTQLVLHQVVGGDDHVVPGEPKEQKWSVILVRSAHHFASTSRCFFVPWKTCTVILLFLTFVSISCFHWLISDAGAMTSVEFERTFMPVN